MYQTVSIDWYALLLQLRTMVMVSFDVPDRSQCMEVLQNNQEVCYL